MLHVVLEHLSNLDVRLSKYFSGSVPEYGLAFKEFLASLAEKKGDTIEINVSCLLRIRPVVSPSKAIG